MNDDCQRLPIGWARATLRDLYTFEYGKALPERERSADGNVPVLGSSGVVGKHSSAYARGPAIVVGRKGAAGSVILIASDFWPIDTTYFIRPPEGIDLSFAFYHLQALRLADLEKSTAIPGLSRDDAYALEVTLPPTSEQRRIVLKLDELFSELDKSLENLNAACEQLDLYRLVILHQALIDSNGNVYPARPLGDLIGEIGQGWSPKCDVNTPAKDGEWAIIKTTAVQPMSYLGHECKPLPSELKPRLSIQVRDDDILMTRKGPRPRTGVVCHVRSARPHSMLCDTVYRFRAREDLVSPQYLEMALNAPAVVQEINSRKSGISESGISLNHGKLRSLPIPVPASLIDQGRIVETVRERMSVVDYQRALVVEQIRRVEVLRLAILKRAFAGRLVAQNHADEPAAKLLERIRAERQETRRLNNKNGKKEAA